ncbi:MAG: phage head-tail connector protein [Selenomonadaceae bacterium]
MNSAEKLAVLKNLLKITDDTHDDELVTYLTFAKNEILSWLYSSDAESEKSVTDVPRCYEQTQIMACIVGFDISGAENQTSHNENGIQRSFKYSDMLQYIRSNVSPFIGVV